MKLAKCSQGDTQLVKATEVEIMLYGIAWSEGLSYRALVTNYVCVNSVNALYRPWHKHAMEALYVIVLVNILIEDCVD